VIRLLGFPKHITFLMQAPKLTILDAEKAARATTCAEACEGEKKRNEKWRRGVLRYHVCELGAAWAKTKVSGGRGRARPKEENPNSLPFPYSPTQQRSSKLRMISSSHPSFVFRKQFGNLTRPSDVFFDRLLWTFPFM
jgi:hypothetical protein